MPFSSIRNCIFFWLLGSTFLTAQLSKITVFVDFLDAHTKCLASSEQVHLVTDRDAYISGERVWLRGFLKAPDSLAETSNVLYVELLDASPKRILRKTFGIHEKSAEGDFVLPDSIRTGHYQIRAYTNVMRNCGAKNHFEKRIAIYNRSKPQDQVVGPSDPPKKVIVMHVDGTSPTQIKVDLIPNTTSAETYIMATQVSGDLVDYREVQPPVNDTTTVILPRFGKGSDAVHIGIFDRNQKLLAAKTVFGTVTPYEVKLATDKTVYKNREKVSGNIGIQDRKGNSIEGEFTISVFKSSPIPDIQSLALNSVATTPQAYSTWQKVMSLGQEEPTYAMERGGILFTGKVTTKDDVPVTRARVVFSVPDSIPVWDAAITNRNGQFAIALNEHFGNRETVVQILEAPVPLENLTITLNKRLPAFDLGSVPYEPIELSDDILEYVYYSNKRIFIENVYQPHLPIKSEQIALREPFFGKPERNILLKNFKPLPTFKEVAREYLGGLKIRRKGIFIIDLPEYTFSKKNAMMLIDGVLMPNPQDIIEMQPGGIAQIMLKKDHFIHKNTFFYGVLSILTKEKNGRSLQLPENALRTKLDFFDRPNSFNTIAYDTLETGYMTLPDLRHTLLWNPKFRLKPNENNNFDLYTSDEKGTYVVKVEGVTAAGDAIRATTTFEVK